MASKASTRTQCALHGRAAIRNRGLPAKQGWFTVKRQAMCADSRDAVGVYFDTTSGEVWASTNEGTRWTCIARHLPDIYSVEATGT